MTTPRDAIARLSERLRAPRMGDPVEIACQLDDLAIEAATAIDSLQARVKELEGQVYVPGSWHCPKCKFTLLQSNLNAQDGTVTARDTPGDKCPNCNSPLWRCSWKNDAFEMQERAVEQMERAKTAEARAARLQQERDEAYERLKPFARMCEVHIDDDAKDSTGIIFPGSSAVIQVGHLRAARDCVRRLSAGPEKIAAANDGEERR